jgi:cysteine dioxygenase
MTTHAPTRTIHVKDLVIGLRQFSESDFRTTGQILEFLKHSAVSPESIEPYLTWDRQHYTRNLIEKNSIFELMAICWEVGQASSVHNHKDQNCWMAVPIGRLNVENFHLVSQDIEKGVCNLTISETIEMNACHPCAVDPNDPVHRVVNPREFNQRAVSLHVYSRPFDSCVVYSPEQGTCGEIKLNYNTEYGKPAARN